MSVVCIRLAFTVVLCFDCVYKTHSTAQHRRVSLFKGIFSMLFKSDDLMETWIEGEVAPPILPLVVIYDTAVVLIHAYTSLDLSSGALRTN